MTVSTFPSLPPTKPVTTLFVFRQQLCALLNLVPDAPLLWRSGAAHPVDFFRSSTPEDLDHWQAEDTDGLPLLPVGLIKVQLANYAASDAGSRLDPGRLLILQHLFASLTNPQAVFCPPTRIDGCYRLLLVAQLEGIWVGLQTYYTDPSQC